MRSLILAVVLSLCAGTAHAASEWLKCVQRGLNELQYDAGEVDGALGPKTAGAAAAFAAAEFASPNGWVLDKLARANAGDWCQEMALRHSVVGPFVKMLVGSDPPAFNASRPYSDRMYSLWSDDYYLSQLPDPSVAAPFPLQHYRDEGWKLGLDPSPWFDTSAYLDANPGVMTDTSAPSPLDHYVHVGMDTLLGFGGVPDESGFIFDIGPGVPQEQVALVKEGLAIAHEVLERDYGGDIPADVRAKITVKLEATGKGNQEPGAGGGNATGLSPINDRLPRPYFDVGHRDWFQQTQGRGWTQRAEQLKMVVHEYVHGWELWYGHASQYQQPLGNWMGEGLAERIAFGAIIERGLMKKRDVDRFEMMAATDRNQETQYTLKQLGSSSTPVWPGHIGYLAMDWLVEESPNGPMSIRILADELVRTNSVKQAFKAAFNIEIYDFYDQHEVWREFMLKNPGTALSKRPELRNIGE